MEHVEYTIIPPVADLGSTASTAAQRSSFCICDIRWMSFNVRCSLTDGSRDITPMCEYIKGYVFLGVIGNDYVYMCL